MILMNIIHNELDQLQKTFGQVEPTPEPAPDNPEEPNGEREKQGTKILLNFLYQIK